ncbi:HprK-related kinase A [Rhodoferax koreense]|uniref:HprK-related kinase A n=1 Tax=Rhodoferax koreensis TaxID=1842727 RepID=A0A1P8JXV2_9BURK|nr:HprK-related kinase A [Rhodoferax koreense]APW38583.1 HprK-related kinase A [Rhodoferax koreense]
MKISELTQAELSGALRRGSLLLDLHPFVARLKSNLPTLAHDLALMYADFPVLPPDTFADFHVEIAREAPLRSGFKPEAVFYLDGRPFFIPLSPGQAFAGLEWGLNWCVTSTSHQYLIFHAAVIEKDGKAAVFPAPPGSGKSTLCAGLVMKGWRLLSDELALYDIDNGLIYGMARPINLKNRSIDVIRTFAPDACLTVPVPNTSKGTVALVRPPVESVLRVREPARPHWVVLPKYQRDAAPVMAPHSRAQSFMLLAEQSFNYHLHGRRGFDAIGQLIDQAGCFQFTYSRLEDAERAFEALRQGGAA